MDHTPLPVVPLTVVATRFNVVFQPKDKTGAATRSNEWLRQRFELFEGICLPSLMAQTDQAFEWLGKSCLEREPGMAWMKVHPAFDRLRSDPRFAQVLRCIGLPA